MTSEPYTTVIVEQIGRVARLGLNRPDRMNAFDATLKRELLSALDTVARLPDIRAVILTGAGKAFCSGFDLKTEELDTSSRRVARTMLYDYQPILELIMRMDKPVLAAVNGAAAGFGMSLALACDLMIMSRESYLLSPFASIGLVPDGGAAWVLGRRLGYGRAFEMLIDGNRVSAARCVEWGLANRVTEAEELSSAALEWASQICEKAPIAVALTKRIARMSQTTGLAEMLAAEAEFQVFAYSTEDSREARAAFVEKRKPSFTGR